MSYRISESDTAYQTVGRFELASADVVESYVRSLAANPRHAYRIERRREGVADVVTLHSTDRTISLHILPPDDIARERLAEADRAVTDPYIRDSFGNVDIHAMALARIERKSATISRVTPQTTDPAPLPAGYETVDGAMQPRHATGQYCECDDCTGELTPQPADSAPQCSDCTVDLTMTNTSWITSTLCRMCAAERRAQVA